MISGKCRILYKNGNIYDGRMEEGMCNKEGTYYSSDSNTWVFGIFNNNKLIKLIEKGVGIDSIS